MPKLRTLDCKTGEGQQDRHFFPKFRAPFQAIRISYRVDERCRSFTLLNAARHGSLCSGIEPFDFGPLFVGCVPHIIARLQVVPKARMGSERV